MTTWAHKRSDASADDEERSRETTPAPPSGVGSPTRPVVLDVVSNEEPDGDGVRPTAVPSYDVEALAAASSWEAQLAGTRTATPLDLCIPVRKLPAVPVEGAPLRAVFLLSHVDDTLSIAEIATTAQIPVTDAIASFLLLADRGVVELRGRSPASRPPPLSASEKAPRSSSGLRTKPET